MLTPSELIKLLNNRGYDFDFHEHNALFTVEDSNKHRGEIKGLHSKNLFLKNKKNKFYLFSCEEFSEINLKTISKSLNLGNLSFAKKEYLLELLGITPGSVSPFALLNDAKKEVRFYLDRSFLDYRRVNFHPLINTATVNISPQNLIDLIEKYHNPVNYIALENLKR